MLEVEKLKGKIYAKSCKRVQLNCIKVQLEHHELHEHEQ